MGRGSTAVAVPNMCRPARSRGPVATNLSERRLFLPARLRAARLLAVWRAVLGGAKSPLFAVASAPGLPAAVTYPSRERAEMSRA